VTCRATSRPITSINGAAFLETLARRASLDGVSKRTIELES
jgi:hypothetical protein